MLFQRVRLFLGEVSNSFRIDRTFLANFRGFLRVRSTFFREVWTFLLVFFGEVWVFLRDVHTFFADVRTFLRAGRPLFGHFSLFFRVVQLFPGDFWAFLVSPFKNSLSFYKNQVKVCERVLWFLSFIAGTNTRFFTFFRFRGFFTWLHWMCCRTWKHWEIPSQEYNIYHDTCKWSSPSESYCKVSFYVFALTRCLS